MIDMNLLGALSALEEEGSLVAAGRRLGLSQPAVHQQLSRLSEQLGRPVYRRVGRKLELTVAGVELVGLARRVARDRDATLGRIHGVGEPTAPPVVAAGAGVWRFLVEDSRGCSPLVVPGPEAIRAVEDGRAAMGVAVGALPGQLEWEPVARTRPVVCVRPQDALAGRGTVSWGELVGQDWVLPPRGQPLREMVEARAPGQVTVEAEGWELLLLFAAQGRGITIVNDVVPIPDGLVAVPLTDGAEQVYKAFWHPSAPPDGLCSQLFGRSPRRRSRTRPNPTRAPTI